MCEELRLKCREAWSILNNKCWRWRPVGHSPFYLLVKRNRYKIKQEGSRINVKKTFQTQKTASQITKGQSKQKLRGEWNKVDPECHPGISSFFCMLIREPTEKPTFDNICKLVQIVICQIYLIKDYHLGVDHTR